MLTIWTSFVLFFTTALSGKSQKYFYLFFHNYCTFEELDHPSQNLVTYLNVVLLSTENNFVSNAQGLLTQVGKGRPG